MSVESVIRQAIEKAAREVIPVMVTEGKVLSVNKEALTCNVERENMPELFNVRLNAITMPGQKVLTIFPSKGSSVLVLLVENNNTDGYVLSATEVEEFVFNGGANGGIAISQKVIDELQEIKDDLNALKTAISSWIAVPQDGGAALKIALTDWYSQTLADPDPGVIINPKVKH